MLVLQDVAPELLHRSVNAPKRCWQLSSVRARAAQKILLESPFGCRQRGSRSAGSALARNCCWVLCAWGTCSSQ